jgi:hypothetical protein
MPCGVDPRGFRASGRGSQAASSMHLVCLAMFKNLQDKSIVYALRVSPFLTQ